MPPETTETNSPMPEEERRKIVRLMRRISRGHYLHQIVNRKTGEILPDGAAASELITLLNTTTEDQWRERLIATIALRYVPIIMPAERGSAALALGKTLKSRYARRAASAVVRAGLCIVIAAFSLIMNLLFVPFPMFSVLAVCLLLASPLVFFLSPVWDTAVNENVQIEAIRTLNILQLVESAGALAKAAREQKCFSRGARQALVQLLPTLTEAHYGRLPNDVTPELCALLLDSETPEHLITLTVEALGKVGDGRAVGPMQKFALSAPTPQLREIAANVLPILTARREQENASSTLLRHSSAPPVDAGLLLRAASGSAVTPPEQLLRPSAGTKAAPDAEN